MNGVLGCAKLLLDTTLDAGTARVRRDHSALAATRCSRILNDVLDYSKIEAGRMSARANTPSTCAPCATTSIDCCCPPPTQRGLQLIVDYRSRRAASRHRRSDAHPAGAAESREQRREVHRARQRAHRGDAAPVKRAVRWCASPTPASASRRAAPEAVRALHAGGFLDHAPLWRHRPRARHLQAARRADGRPIGVTSVPGKGSTFSFVLPLLRTPGSRRSAGLRAPAARAQARPRRTARRARAARRRQPRQPAGRRAHAAEAGLRRSSCADTARGHRATDARATTTWC